MSKVSVVMPVYNCERTLANSIDSVLNQTYKEFELIIINDGSTDQTRLICEDYVLKDNRIKLINGKNNGPSVARNIGIKNSTGDYLMCIDADDTYDINMLSYMVKKIKETNTDLVICGINKHFHKNGATYNIEKAIHPSAVWSNKSTILQNVEELIQDSIFFNAPVNKLYKVKIIKENNVCMNKDLDIGEDFLFNLRYLEFCNSISIIPLPLYNYYIGNNYLTSKYRENMFELRKGNISELKKFYLKYKIQDEITDFLYIKLAYACFMQLFHKDNEMKFTEKINYIYNIIRSDDISNSLKNFKPHNLQEKILSLIMKSQAPIYIFLFSKILYTVRKSNLIKWKSASL